MMITMIIMMFAIIIIKRGRKRLFPLFLVDKKEK